MNGIMLKEKILSVAKNEIRLQYNEHKTEETVGISKIGGNPDVPVDFRWPQFELSESYDSDSEHIPLTFIAQINLKDICAYDSEKILPHDGVLSFFYELETMCWGIDPLEKGCAKVIYFPNADELVPMNSPSTDMILPELRVHFDSHISLPSYEEFEKIGNVCSWEEYDDFLESIGYEYDELGKRTKMIGYADVIQHSMELHCEIMSRGYNYEDYMEFTEKEKAEIQGASEEWMMLFQMGTIETEGYSLMFGDCGHIYFWIKKSDLQKMNFNHVWLILQCG